MKNLQILFPIFMIVLITWISSCTKNSIKENPDLDPWSVDSEKPAIVHMGWARKGLLGITIKEGNLNRTQFGHYNPQPGDSIAIDTTETGIIHHRILIRDGVSVGYIAGADHQYMGTFETITGDTIDETLLDNSSTYIISAGAGFRNLTPDTVFRKSKILTKSNHTEQIAMLHTVYLQLPLELADKKEINIQFKGINITEESLTFYNTPELTRSESVHVNHSGFRPDDPVKTGYLSLWLGTGGACTFDGEPLFRIIDRNDGQTYYRGVAHKALAADNVEILHEEKNYSKTEVWHLDFSDFNRPGRYVLSVDEIGTSFPFQVDNFVWQDNFETTMLGFLTHRSGLEITTPMDVNFTRPRSFHPEDGLKIFESNFSLLDNWIDYGGSQEGAFEGLAKYKTDSLVQNGWGGYMDAGDWDRRIHHLNSTRQLLELYQLYPEYFRGLVLTLPTEETNNGIPDILDESAWNIDFYGRLQEENGAIPLGIESAAHPVNGEPSWLESLPVFKFAGDPHSSFIYAGVAAQMARSIAEYDSVKARWYTQTAEKAFAYGIDFPNHPRYSQLQPNRIQNIKDQASIAAIELYKLTSNPEYFVHFKANSIIFNHTAGRQSPSPAHLDAAFALATTLPDQTIQPGNIQMARDMIISHAQEMLDMINGNSFNLVNRRPGAEILNGYYSAANNQELCRAFYLTGETDYLEAAILSVQYTAGANPMNMTLTTGLGHRYPMRPLHLDSEFTGQPEPWGITVYAQADHEYFKSVLPEEQWGSAWGIWATNWFSAKMNTPSGWEWPPHEAYIDYSRFPAMNEYTVHQTFGPISYAYGFLAARPVLAK